MPGLLGDPVREDHRYPWRRRKVATGLVEPGGVRGECGVSWFSWPGEVDLNFCWPARSGLQCRISCSSHGLSDWEPRSSRLGSLIGPLRSLSCLPDPVEPFAIIPVGYPEGNFGPVTRRPLEDVVHYERW